MRVRHLLIAILAAVLFAGCFAPSGAAKTSGSSTKSGASKGKRSDVVATAKRYLGTPYRYGGSDPQGFDCSGFVLYVFSRHGVSLPRSAEDQFKRLSSIRNPEPGDLVFYNTFGSGVSHVGIFVGNNTFIHSPTTGKTVEYADMRIDYWKGAYRGARRAL
jgi:cell wall-associated NlpC family hydrolase